MANFKQRIPGADVHSDVPQWPNVSARSDYKYGDQAIWKYGIQQSWNKKAAKYNTLDDSIGYKNVKDVGKLLEHLISVQNKSGAIKTAPMGLQNLYKKLKGVPFALKTPGMSGIQQHAGAGMAAMLPFFSNNIQNMGQIGKNATLTASLIGTNLMNPDVANSDILPSTNGAVAVQLSANTNPANGMGIATNAPDTHLHVNIFTVGGVTFTALNASGETSSLLPGQNLDDTTS